LREYLRFRHFFRHAYGYTLEWNKMQWKVVSIAETLALLREELQDFFAAVMSSEGNGDR